MRRFAVFVQTFTSVVDLAKNTTSADPVGVMDPPRAGYLYKEDWQEMEKMARKTFGIRANQRPQFRELPPVVHIFADREKTLCGRDFALKPVRDYSNFANCKNCLKKENKTINYEKK